MKHRITTFITVGLTIAIILLLISCGSFGNMTSYEEPTYTETTMAMEQTLEPIYGVPTTTNIPSLTLTPLPPTITAIPSVELSPTLTPDLKFRITYITYDTDEQNNIINSQLWIILPPYQQSTLIYQPTVKGEIIVGYSWGRNEEILAVEISNTGEENESVRVEIFNLQSNESFSLTEPIVRENNELYLHKDAFSANNNWINVNYINYYDASIISQIYAINAEVGWNPLTIAGEFLLWSSRSEDQYAYLSRQESMSINLGVVGIDAPIASIINFGDITPIPAPLGFSWSNDGLRAIVPATGPNGKTSYLELDFQSEDWEQLVTSDKELSVFEQWSPDDKWITLYKYDEGLYLFNLDNSDSSLIQVNADVSAFPIGWLADGNLLIYQEGFLIYLVDPVSPQYPILIHDFTELFQDFYPYLRIDLHN